MTGDSIDGAVSGAAWSKRNVAGTAIALIGFGGLVFAVAALAQLIGFFLLADKGNSAFDWSRAWVWGVRELPPLIVSLCLIRFNRRIARAICREEEGLAGAPLDAREVALAFGIRGYSAFLATYAGIQLVQRLPDVFMFFRLDDLKKWLMQFGFSCFFPLAMLLVSLYFLRRPEWPVSFADREGELDEDEGRC